MILKFLVFFLSASLGSASDQDMCKLCEKGMENEHIFCKFPNPGPPDSSSCGSVDKSITDDKFRDKVLHWHNDYRNKFASGSWKDQGGKFPKAADMRALTYDCELEKLAMRNVQNCFYKHEKCRATKRFSYGQNLAYMSSSAKSGVEADTEKSWEAWVAEMKDFKVSDNIKKFSTDGSTDPVLHFTQATWASVRVLGCAQATSKQGSWYRIDVACNYGPSGNMMGDVFYTPGEPGTKCPKGTQKGLDPRYPNLCATGDTRNTTIEEDKPFQRPCSKGNSIIGINACILVLTIFINQK